MSLGSLPRGGLRKGGDDEGGQRRSCRAKWTTTSGLKISKIFGAAVGWCDPDQIKWHVEPKFNSPRIWGWIKSPEDFGRLSAKTPTRLS
jgi:hypothetical protein